MSEKQAQLAELKQAHDYFATAIHVMRTRVQWYFEEFDGVSHMVNFLETHRASTQKLIEEIEPPKPKEPQKPFEIEVPITEKMVEDALNGKKN